MRPHTSRSRLPGWLVAAVLLAAVVMPFDDASSAPESAASAPMEAADLRHAASEATAAGAVLVLEFWAEDCPYCRLLDEQVLIPLLKSGESKGRMVLRRVDIYSPGLVDFSGRRVSGQELADRYRVGVTPTLLLLAPDGREIGERMVGINAVDYYGAYLDAALDTALEKLSGRP